jgi:lipoprotein-releasing system permease protein
MNTTRRQTLSLSPWLPFEAWVALRFLREGYIQTVFILVGVAIGVGVVVFMSAMLSALQANFVRRVLTGQPHIQLLPSKEVVRPQYENTAETVHAAIIQSPLQRLKSIDQWQSIATQIRSMPGILVVSPVVSGSSLVVRGDASRAITVVGIEPDLYFQIVPLPEKIVSGSANVAVNDLLIGTELASDLGVGPGEKLRITAANGNSNVLTVKGVFDLGNKGPNTRTTFMALRSAQSLLGLTGGVSTLDVTLSDVYQAEDISKQMASIMKVKAESWIKTNEQFFTAIRAQTAANTTIRFFVGLSVAFGIASVLVVVVVQKSREIGILRAMGTTRAQILSVFLLQGGLMGLGGALAGALMGFGALKVWEQTQRNPDGSVMFALNIEPRLFVMALLLATVTGVFASVAPALRAARLDPAVAIRG